jgi:hypothetical protein
LGATFAAEATEAIDDPEAITEGLTRPVGFAVPPQPPQSILIFRNLFKTQTFFAMKIVQISRFGHEVREMAQSGLPDGKNTPLNSVEPGSGESLRHG